MEKVVNLGVEVSGFIFYLYEIYSFFHHPQAVSLYDNSVFIFSLRFLMLLLALPLLYIFRIAYYFDWGDALIYFASDENKNAFSQVKLFYYAIYIILSFLLFLDIIDYIYKFFS